MAIWKMVLTCVALSIASLTMAQEDAKTETEAEAPPAAKKVKLAPTLPPAPRQVRLSADLALWFADDSGVASKSGVERVLHPAQTRPQPVLASEKPNERVYVYGSAYSDGAGGMQMWFMRVGRPGAGEGTDVLYAQSKDGITWPKVSECKEVFSVSSPAVILDAFEKDPEKKFKLLGGKKEYKAAYSADGVKWTQYPDIKVNGGDTLTLAQDPYTGEFLCYHKRERIIREEKRRVVALMKSKDLQTWTSPTVVLTPDEEDDKYERNKGESMQIYNMSVFPHAAGYVGLPAMFKITRVSENDPPNASRQDGPIDVQLATSADGLKWARSEPRTAMIPRGQPGSFDAGAILAVCSTAVHTPEYTWVYYTGITTGHGGVMPAKKLSIGLAQWRRHGFASLDARDSGRVETVPMLLSGATLVVNADASKGELKAALLEADGRPIAGYGLEESAVMKADSTAWTAAWQGKKEVPADRPVKVVVEMKGASLYSLGSGVGK
jgi:hypothetical protein